MLWDRKQDQGLERLHRWKETVLWLFDLIWHRCKPWQNHIPEQQILMRVTWRHGPRWFLGSQKSVNNNFHVPKEPISFTAWPAFGSNISFNVGLDQNKWKLPTSVVGKRRGAVSITLPKLLLSLWQLGLNCLFPKLCFWQWQEKGKLTGGECVLPTC